jgi:hypothetical protein
MEQKEAMSGKVVPIIHVPDVRATVTWYESYLQLTHST